MKKYDFDELIIRKGTGSYKWDSKVAEDALPMWVADMDFRTCPAIIESLRERVDHGIFGYTAVPDEFYSAVTDWFSRRHGWHFTRERILYTSGVVPAFSAIIKALCTEDDKVMVQTPVYNCFFSSIRNNGCEVISSPLVCRGNTYVIDFEDFESRIRKHRPKVFVLCNPHNPVGRVWTEDELRRIGRICIDNGVTVVSDEIHCELTYGDNRYIPFASLSEEFAEMSVSCISPSKSFNIAGLQIACIVSDNPVFRAKIDKALNINEVCDVNPFGVIATVAAYQKGEDWLDELKSYLYANYLYMKDSCEKELADFPICRLEGTYLVWMDCSSLRMMSSQIEEDLLSEEGLLLNSGTIYGPEGEGFMRWNIACPRARLEDGLRRFKRFADGRKQ